MNRLSQTCLRVFATALLLSCLRLPAQITTAEITGTVTDSAGAVIVGAKVTASNSATNTQRTVTTSSAGVYNLTALPPGAYSLRVEMQGFTSQVRSNFELQVAQVARFDVSLQVGNVAEVVEVQGAAPLIETDNTSLGTVIENQRIIDLPLNGRNYLQLAALTPGATTAAPASFVMGLRQGGTRSLFTLTVSGQRIIFNRYLLDGLENTSPNWQSYIFLPSLDALQEFKVESGITPAEYGKNATQINVTTKSGTNELHGSAWEFVRNSYFDARNYFNAKSTPQPPFKRNQFGFTIGGPMFLPKVFNGRNKLFFMVNYEGLRERKALVQPATVPPSAWVNGDFSAVSTQSCALARNPHVDERGHDMAAKAADGDVGEWRINNNAMTRLNVRERRVDDLVIVVAVMAVPAMIAILVVICPTIGYFDDGGRRINHGGA